jgi:hypothetical protein
MPADVIHTAEVRWFFEGPLEDAIVRWFDPGAALQTDVRTDRYLVLPGCETVGVKERDGRFEIKARKGNPCGIEMPAPFEGAADRWVKWSYGQPPVELWIGALRREATGWVAVEKSRRLRVFKSSEFDAEHAVDPACQGQYRAVELTSLRVNSRRWWTLGFEAVEPPDRRCASLAATVALFCRGRSVLQLFPPENALPYPAWLSRLAR